MAKTPQGNAGKQKISLAPVRTLSDTPAKPEPIALVMAVPKPVVPASIAATPPGTPKPVISAPVTAAAPASAKPAALIPAPAVIAPAKPASFVPVAPVPAPVAAVAAAPVMAKHAAPVPEDSKPAPLVLKPVAVAPKPVAVPAPTVIKPPVAAVVDKPAKAAPAPVLSLSIIPTHPGMTDFDAETWFAPALNAIRALAAFQGKVLDHACAELKATLAEAEALARAASPSEAVALQGKAFSRRLDASSAHIADLTTTVRKIGKAA